MLKRFHIKKTDGFALPTTLIASLTMMIVLLMSVQTVSSITSALRSQYLTMLSNEAIEAGVAKAEACLKANNYLAQWTTKPLRPNGDCTGADPCTTDSCYFIKTDRVRVGFVVDPPATAPGSQQVRVKASVELLRATGGSVYSSSTSAGQAKVGAETTFSNVIFGYDSNDGAFFVTLDSDGKAQALGANDNGRLGNGTYQPTLVPTDVILPSGFYTTNAYTNFLSVGWNMFFKGADGSLYGAGRGSEGQLGSGGFSNSSTPVRFILPAGVTVRHVDVLGRATYVIADDGRVFSAGECGFGLLGYSYIMGGCVNQSTYQQVALPTPSPTDANTRPTTNMVSDRLNAYIRMEGGRVYGWGINDRGQLANGTTTSSSTPVKIGTYGDAGQPKATQVAFDGDTVYILDDTGKVKAAGKNDVGQLGGGMAPIASPANGRCLDATGSTAPSSVVLWDCINNWNSQKWAWGTNGSITNGSGLCLDAYQNGVNGGGVNIYTCNGGLNQQWDRLANGTIKSRGSGGGCLDANNTQLGSNGTAINTATCHGGANQQWNLMQSTVLVDFAIPASAGKIIKMSTDQWFVCMLTELGQVWCSGGNWSGQLGNGQTSSVQILPVRFNLPVGVTAQDVYVTHFISGYTNVYVIGSNGRVYGAGDNDYGQLGDATTTDRSTPVAMNVIDGVTIRASKVQAGYGTAVILTDNGVVYTVGNNAKGQLGDGTTINSSTPKANQYTNVKPPPLQF